MKFDKKILFVEDDEALGESIFELLKLNRFTVFWFRNGIDAYAFINETRVDIIVSDLMMPIMDGEEFLTLIRKDKKFDTIPFIFITANTSPDVKVRQLESGVNDFITKPFKISELILKIKNILLYTEKIREHYESKPEHKITVRNKIKDFKAALDEVLSKHLVEDLTMDFVAGKLYISKSSLDKKIRKMKGCNFSQYIREFRLDYALRLMETGNYSIKEVADNSGFRSTSFFSTSFKKYMNISPKKYQLRLNNR